MQVAKHSYIYLRIWLVKGHHTVCKKEWLHDRVILNWSIQSLHIRCAYCRIRVFHLSYTLDCCDCAVESAVEQPRLPFVLLQYRIGSTNSFSQRMKTLTFSQLWVCYTIKCLIVIKVTFYYNILSFIWSVVLLGVKC